MQIHTHLTSPRTPSRRPVRSILNVARAFVLALLLLPTLSAAKDARGAQSDDGPWMAALQERFVVLDVTTGDLDGDGADETALCYEDPTWTDHVGLVVLKRNRGSLSPVFHAVVELTCEKVKIASGRVGVQQEKGARGPPQVVWKYGTQLVFAGAEGHPTRGTRATASSELSGGGVTLPAGTIDGNLATSWAEGASGTGIGETVTLRLPQKLHVAYIGVFGGHGGGERAFYDHNRIHRGSIKTQTADDLGDEDTGIDFADLGLEIGGDRLEFDIDNRPKLEYVRVDKKDVEQIELRIESVYLGQRRDDTHVAEIEIVPLLPIGQLVAAPAVAKGNPTSPTRRAGNDKKPKIDVLPELPGNLERGNKAVGELDKSGRSIVDDVDDF
jgi:hypothetical protein